MTLLLMFYLLMPPTTTQICALWLSQPPTPADFLAACPEGIDLEHLTVRFRNIGDGKVVCEKNATAIWAIDRACHFGKKSLDNYRMEIVRIPEADEKGEVVCVIESYNNPPTRQEIDDACSWEALNAYQNGIAGLLLIGEVPAPTVETVIQIQAPEIGEGLYDQPISAAALSTDESLTWLAGRLIWHGQVVPDCPDGLSGLDPITLAATTCGLEASAPLVEDWQNQFDEDIYAAALAEGVPARLFKRVLRLESQFWPMWENRLDGEIGLAQITANGADTYLRWYTSDYGYASAEQQIELQSAFIESLRCNYCTLEEAIQQERANLVIYARILKAYRYASSDWRAALVLWNGQNYAEKVEQLNG